MAIPAEICYILPSVGAVKQTEINQKTWKRYTLRIRKKSMMLMSIFSYLAQQLPSSNDSTNQLGLLARGHFLQ